MFPSFLSVKDHMVNDQAMLSILSKQYRQLPLNASDRQYCLDYTRRQINQVFGLQGVNKTLPDSIPETLLRYNALCFLSLYCDGKVVSCLLGQGMNLIRAIDDAVRHSANTMTQTCVTPLIALCFLFNERIAEINLIRLGIDGIALKQKNITAYFKNSVPIHHHFNITTTLEKLSEKAGLEKNSYLLEDTSLYIFDALEFTEDENGMLCDWYRGNPLLLNTDINKNNLKIALTLALQFFDRTIIDAHESIYLVYPSKQTTTHENSLSALTRLIASLWQYTEITKTDNAKKKLTEIVKKHFIYHKKTGYCAHDNKTHLGINSLLLMAILSFDDDQFLVLEKKLLVAWIETHISPDKKYFLLKTDDALLYVGQALLVLMTLYEKTNEKKYLHITESVFSYCQNLFYQTQKKTVMSHWFSRAYLKVFFVTQDMRYAEFVFTMNDDLLQYQIPAGFHDVDVTGAFSPQGDSRTTATFIESLLCACQIAESSNDQVRLLCYKNAIMLALRALLQMQLMQDHYGFTQAVGGFKNNIFDNTIRIDNVQHAIGAIENSLACIFH